MLTRILIIIFLFNLLIFPAFAQSNAMALSITPPLIKNNIIPGQIWKSTVKVVNNNSEELTVYVQAIDFQGNGEDGTVTFISSTGAEDETDYLLSKWINLPNESITIAPSKSYEVPFIVDVPETAVPGGHYAAILVGTKPPDDKISGASIKVSSLLASLIMLNVSGEVNEDGQIREFSTDKTVYGEGEVDFKVRFENLGNVHVQPQGEIRVFDMWSEEMASIKINHSTEFGNVLPGDIRTWDFNWKEKINLFDMGRYRAELILTYGNQAKETLTQTRYFWIFLFKPLGFIMASVLFVLLIFYLLIRRSIKRAIRETERLSGVVHPDMRVNSKVTILPKENNTSDSVIVNLKNKGDVSPKAVKQNKKGLSWKGFKRFVLITILLLIVIGLAFIVLEYWPMFNNPQESENKIKEYSASVIEQSKEQTSTSSIVSNELSSDSLSTSTLMEGQLEKNEKKEVIPSAIVLNGGGMPGAASRAEELLGQAGFEISELGNADNFNYESTVIRHSEDMESSAKRIGELFPDPVELELVEGEEVLTVIVGKEF